MWLVYARNRGNVVDRLKWREASASGTGEWLGPEGIATVARVRDVLQQGEHVRLAFHHPRSAQPIAGPRVLRVIKIDGRDSRANAGPSLMAPWR